MEAQIPQETGLIVIAVRKQTDETHQFVFNPVANTRLEPGDEMIVLGQPKQVDQLRNTPRPKGALTGSRLTCTGRSHGPC